MAPALVILVGASGHDSIPDGEEMRSNDSRTSCDPVCFMRKIVREKYEAEANAADTISGRPCRSDRAAGPKVKSSRSKSGSCCAAEGLGRRAGTVTQEPGQVIRKLTKKAFEGFRGNDKKSRRFQSSPPLPCCRTQRSLTFRSPISSRPDRLLDSPPHFPSTPAFVSPVQAREYIVAPFDLEAQQQPTKVIRFCSGYNTICTVELN